jgi:diaminohydroxyphosphoribosylaminopyrimidine deaminase/5-amino-6-(5-phosphoribosylamino)uracil reductase
MSSTIDPSILERAMRRALDLAATPGVPHGPNPRVGCVLLAADGSVIAEGFHRGAGTPHAEAAALATAYELGGPDSARGATAVVTLEPCNHVGRTGPCAQALIGAGVARVVFAQPDPNPLAAGGAATLRGVGIAVETGLLEREARLLNRAWTFALEHGRPFVTWKLATSLDGRSAAADGTSRWITGEGARRDVHRLRSQCDAILVGTGTVLADDPALTVRDEVGGLVDHQPLRVVLGERDLPDGARLRDPEAETLHLRTRDVAAAVSELHELGVQHVFLEGGPTVGAAFLVAGLVDEVVAYIAPKLLGSGPHAVGDLGIDSISSALELVVEDVTVLDQDVRVTGRPRRHGRKD